MPTTIGHSLAAFAVNGFNRVPINKSMMITGIVVANLADIDFLPGFFVGDPNRFHHGPTHSIAAAVFVGIFVAWLTPLRKLGFGRVFVLIFSLYFSHILLDFFAADTSSPFGVPLFWPISDQYFISGFSIFSDVHKDSSSGTFIQSLLVTHNFWTIIREVLILTPLTFLWFKLGKTRS